MAHLEKAKSIPLCLDFLQISWRIGFGDSRGQGFKCVQPAYPGSVGEESKEVSKIISGLKKQGKVMSLKGVTIHPQGNK